MVIYLADWLVVWNHGMDCDFPYLGNVIIPTDELHHFSEELKPPTSYIYIYITNIPNDYGDIM